MTIELDVILSEFNDDAEAWVLQDQESMKYVILPDINNPGRKPIRFYLKKEDAESIFNEIKNKNTELRNKSIKPIKVKLKPSLKSIAVDNNPENADSFVVHGPVEIYEFVRDRIK